MPKSRSQKETIVNELEAKVKDAKAFFVLTTSAINPNEAAELKIKLAEVGGEYHVVKNALFKFALEKAGFEALESGNAGQNAVVFVGDKSPEAAKIVKEFIKANPSKDKADRIAFKEGMLEGKKISAEDVKSLAELPSRDQMIAQVLATMNAPLTGFVNVLAGNIRAVITVIDAIKAQK